MKTTRHLLRLAALLGLASLLSQTGSAQTSAFTYQGVLQDGAAPANGLYDFEFRVFNAASGGGQVGVLTTAADLPVTNGLFTATIDPGAGTGVFPGGARWLNIAVRPGGSAGAYTNLSPRQPITSTPYASFARGAAAAGVTGTLPPGALSGAYSGSINLSNAANSFAGSGAGLTALDASNLASGTVADARLSANVALRAGGNNLTGDQTVMSGRVGIGTTNTTRAILEQAGVAGGATAAIFGGGGTGIGLMAGFPGIGFNSYFNGGTRAIAGGHSGGILLNTGNGQLILRTGPNVATDALTTETDRMTILTNGNVGIGTTANIFGRLTLNNTAVDGAGTIADGLAFTDNVGGGTPWTHAGIWTVGSSGFNGNLAFGTDGDGARNNAVTERMRITSNGNVGIGTTNPTVRLEVAGAVKAASFTGDGSGLTNLPNGMWSVDGANVYRPSGNVGIGTGTPTARLEVKGASGTLLTLGSDVNASGQEQGIAFAIPAFLGTSKPARITAITRANDANEINFFTNPSFGTAATHRMIINQDGNVGIGTGTPASLLHLQGGTEQLRFSKGGGGAWSAALGLSDADPNVLVINSRGDIGTFGAIHLATGGTNRITIGSPAQGGNVGIGTANPSTKLDIAGEATMTACNITSDRNAKEDFKPINTRAVLEKVASLAITEWQYKTQPGVRHIGPVAQDFRAAFATGRDDKHITTVDADGVALAAIQGLNEVLEEKEAEIGALKDRLTAMETRFRALEEALQQAAKLR